MPAQIVRITWQNMIPDPEVLKLAGLQKHPCPTEESSTSMGWPCCQNERWKVTKAPAIWRTGRGEEVYWRSTQMSWRPPQILAKGLWSQQRSLIRKGPESYEQTTICQAEGKRLFRKSSAAETSSAIITAIPCPNCDRTFRARIGLISHIRTHRPYARDQRYRSHHSGRMDEQVIWC